MSGALIGALDSVGVPGSEERLAVDRWLKTFVEDLPASPELDRLIAECKRFVLGKPALRRAAALVWREAERALTRRGPDGTLRLRDAVARMIENAGGALETTPSVRQYLGDAVERALLDYIVPWREHIGRYIASVVEAWDPREVTRIIELQVGRDLQYVRLNGTLIGALIGVGLFLASWFGGFR
jgi:uncharacterized membrane-anchored protein YjiN (DUF445 family)